MGGGARPVWYVPRTAAMVDRRRTGDGRYQSGYVGVAEAVGKIFRTRSGERVLGPVSLC
ncbi:hypothetical protein FRAHR75_1200012 [Frankia sp. Hr75.2]|nr:hypothetical protein FRAHR75_1200012 [Frankia sp. Hr75.2]SQD95432.1 hypothetical protein FMEAI12_3130038 [Parafrankia sp. Ea1.12]